MTNANFDWIIVGAGAAGILLQKCSQGWGLRSLVEKNDKLAGETTRVFHEWLHTGSLYTLVPDNLKTTRYLLGAIDDLFEYYSGFKKMNLSGTMNGLNVNKSGWFNDENIYYRYRARPLNAV